MIDKNKKNSRLQDMVCIANTEILLLGAVIEGTKYCYNLGCDIAPNITEYVGSIGAGAVKYGLPAVGLCCLLATCAYTGVAIHHYNTCEKVDWS